MIFFDFNLPLMKDYKAEKYFELGKRAGFEEGVAYALKRQFKDTSQLSEKEETMLINFLVNNDMELCYYSSNDEPNANGFSVRKRNFGWKEREKSYNYDNYKLKNLQDKENIGNY